MIGKFGESLGGKLGEQYLRTALGAAGAYWFVVALLLGYRLDFLRVFDAINHMQPGTQILGIAVGLAVLLTSAAAVDAFVFPVTRFLEGYGPVWQIVPFSDGCRAMRKHFGVLDARRQELAPKIRNKTATSGEKTEWAAVNRKLAIFPDVPDDFMPTTLGNILRRAERRPRLAYGLDAVVTWFHLWMVLSESAKKEYLAAQSAMDAAIKAYIWGALLIPWSAMFLVSRSGCQPQHAYAALGVVAFSVIAMIVAYRRSCDLAQPYASILQAAFDLERTRLYTAMRFPPPKDFAEDRALGERVTRFVLGGFTAGLPPFAPPSDANPAKSGGAGSAPRRLDDDLEAKASGSSDSSDSSEQSST